MCAKLKPCLVQHEIIADFSFIHAGGSGFIFALFLHVFVPVTWKSQMSENFEFIRMRHPD